MALDRLAGGFRYARTIAVVVGSCLLVWRGNTFDQPGHEPGLLVPVMCVLSAITFAMTACFAHLRADEPAL
jgi:hypothetical protein